MSVQISTHSRIGVREAATRSGVSTNTVLRRINQGQLPAVKIGKSFLVIPDDVDRVFAPIAVVPKSSTNDALEAAIASAVAAAPPLTLHQRDRIIFLLGGA